MLNRRIFLGGLSASLPLFATSGSLRAQGAAPRLHAMIVGINIYTGRDGHGRPIRALRGCQNDAADIERQVRRFQPATLVRLGWDAAAGRDLPVTRADFFRTWEQVLAGASSGDRLLLTYAGHGSQIPVLPGNPSGETDGLDETLVLTGFDASLGRGAEHIIDDELDVMFQAAKAKNVIVCFISDSCHSGTLTRSVDELASDKTYRWVPRTPDPPGPPGTPPPLLENLVFLAGAQENETVPEIRDPDTGQHRGALSLAVGRALAGGAVTDGVVTVRSLASFVRRQVRLLAEGVQTADIVWPSIVTEHGVSADTRLFVVPGGSPPVETKRPPVTALGSRTVGLRIRGRSMADAERIVRGLRGAVLARPGEAEALVWDSDRRLVLNGQGDRVAENVGERELQGVVDCRLALDHLIALASNGSLEVKIEINGRDTRASDAVHKPGEKLAVKVSGFADGDYLAVFNFAGLGMVQMLEPTPYHAANPTRADFKSPHFNTGRQVSGTERSIMDVDVGEPFGADHVIAVAGARPLTRLMAALVAAERQYDIPGVLTGLASEGATQTLKIGLRGIYTWRS
jgi:caspase domain-containing protein